MKSLTTENVKPGLEILLNQNLHLIKKQRVGLVSHPAAIMLDYSHTLDALLSNGIKVTALFAPEHGFHSAEADGAAVKDDREPRTGLPIFSLYGSTKEPGQSMLEQVDTLVFDMQDIGVRFYTYLSTLYYILKASGEYDKPVVVLDRPNPINGIDLEGWALEPGLESFVGIVSIPIRHGLTLGELALWMNQTCQFKAPLTVVEMQGWKRRMWFDQTGLPWVSTSPGIPQIITTITYPATCFLEGTNLSEGRGTSLPFEMCGAPWLNAYTLAERLNKQKLPGVYFRPVQFIPSASKHAGKVCNGVQVHVVDRHIFRPITVGVHLLAAFRQENPDRFEILPSSWEGRPPHLDLLAGTSEFRLGLENGLLPEEILAPSLSFTTQFALSRRPFLRYDEE